MAADGAFTVLDYEFPGVPDVKRIEAELDDDWQRKFEGAKMDGAGTVELAGVSQARCRAHHSSESDCRR